MTIGPSPYNITSDLGLSGNLRGCIIKLVDKGQGDLPEPSAYQANVKILHRFHTEFILDRGMAIYVLDQKVAVKMD